MRRFALLLAALLLSGAARADEGMWLIHRLQPIAQAMHERGLQLDIQALYNPEGVDLSDAVVAIDYGVGTGSIISEQGLMITNHHVAFSDICALSTPEKNLLVEGFWAQTQEEELPVKGKTVSFLRSVSDITQEAVAYRDSLERIGKWGIMGPRKLVSEMERRHRQAGLEPWCAQMWDGELFLLLQYEVYKDVRLVGAPPQRIGAFGGEVDNWGWPQHKGDFALYRIYGNAAGQPADYHPDNQPIQPRQVLQISTAGVQEGDYAMVIGYPGRTHRYGSPYAVEERMAKNPIVEHYRHDRMERIRHRMEQDSLVRLAYSDSYFNLSNYADYTRWEQRCLKRFDVVAERTKTCEEMARWVAADPVRQAQDGELFANLEHGYRARHEAVKLRTHFQESWLNPSRAMILANRISIHAQRIQRNKERCHCPKNKLGQGLCMAVSQLEEHYDEKTDRELLIGAMKRLLAELPDSLWSDHLKREYNRYKGDVERLFGEAFDRSCCRNAEAFRAFVNRERTPKQMLQDPLVALAGSMNFLTFSEAVEQAEREVGVDVDGLERHYRRMQYHFREAMQQPQYPDANSTMRLTYGRVCNLEPRDGITYDYRSTLRGYCEKEDPTNYDFEVDERLKTLLREEGYDLTVNFLTDNDITGGNSGSPMLNAEGKLIGLAFDGNRESMAGDLWYHPTLTRTVAVDIRYVLWLIEHYAQADRLVQELNLGHE